MGWVVTVNNIVTEYYLGPDAFAPDGAIQIDDEQITGLGLAALGSTLVPSTTGGSPTLVPAPPPTPPPPTEAELVAALVAAGLSITFASNPDLTGVYACDATKQASLLAEMVSIISMQTFTNGETTLAWPDITNQFHTFDLPTFPKFAAVIGRFITTLDQNGSAGAPVQPVVVS